MSWTTGYTMPVPPDRTGQGDPDPDAGGSWAALRAGFEWTVPDTYNIGAEVRGTDPEATALEHVDAGDRYHAFTYGALARAADAVAAGLVADGVERGDRVGVCLPQCPEHLLVHLAAYRVGAVAVPLSVLLGAESVAHQLDHGDVTVLFVDGARLAALPSTAVADVDTVRPVDPGGYESALGGLRDHVDPDGSSGGAGGEGAGAGAGDTDGTVGGVETAPDDPALVLYTSGTGGRPKGVLAGHRYLLGSLPAYHCYFHLFTAGAARRARVWSPSEWAWAGALFNVVLPTLALGGTVVSRERRAGFDPDRALALVERRRVSRAFLPPTALGRVRTEAAPEAYDLSSLAVVQCGGEALPPSLFRWAERALDCTVNEAYGQTEANGLVGNCGALFDPEAGSMGRPYPGHDVAVVDGDGDRLGPGERGELAVRTPDPAVFLGYADDPAATAERFDGEWFLTGDLARFDEDGRLWHAGRADDLIVTSGYRVSPLEVERVLAADSAVADAVVGGVPDPDRGERVAAHVVLATPDGSPPDGADRADVRERLRERVRAELGAHKVPRTVEFADSLPETRSGKVDRSALFDDS